MAKPDPILAALADLDAAQADHARIDGDHSLSDEEHLSRSRVAGNRVMMLEQTLNGIVPTTMGGLQALVAHHARNDEHPETARRIGAILEGCDSTLRFSALKVVKAELYQQVASVNRPSVSEAVSLHRAAWEAFQIAPHEDVDLDAAYEAQGDMQDALDEVLITPCTNRIEALALRFHLQWWLAEEVEQAADYQPKYAIAEARVAELGMLLNGGVP